MEEALGTQKWKGVPLASPGEHLTLLTFLTPLSVSFCVTLLGLWVVLGF